jgi:hypothetical protein
MNVLLEQLNDEAITLFERINGINSFIESNMDTDPNLYEMTQVTVDFGILARKYNDYFKEFGYPEIKRNGGVVTASEEDLVVASPALGKVYNALNHMYKLRKNSFAFKNEIISNFCDYLRDESVLGHYDISSDNNINNIKRDLLCKIMSVTFYIAQVQHNENENYKYDNVNEFNQMLDWYSKYKEGTSSKPQFGREIEKAFTGIYDNYKYKNSNLSNNKLNELENEAENISNRLNGINNWIKENKDTVSEPNLYEITDSIISYGIISKKYDDYYKEVGYPIVNINDEEVEINSSNVYLSSEKLGNVKDCVDEMLKLRGDSYAFDDPIISDFITELYSKASTSEYDILKDMDMAQKKHDILCKAMGIYFYIIQVQYNNDSEYKYDNINEFEQFIDNYREYKEYSLGVYETQFEDIIEETITGINNNYKYNNDDQYSSNFGK